MTPPEAEPLRRALIRLSGLVLAIGLSVAGVCLVAFAESPTRIRLGFPVALWGVLIGAWALHGSRPRQELAQTELSLRRDLHDSMRAELVAVRQELSGLRAEVVLFRQDGAGRPDRTGRRLEIERTETTRVLLSDAGDARLDVVPATGYVGRRRHVSPHVARPALGPRHGRADEDDELAGAAAPRH